MIPFSIFEVGNAVCEEPARPRVLLVNMHVVPRSRELLCGREARRTRADDGDLLSGLLLRRQRRDPSLRERPVRNRAFDGLDGDRIVVDVERAGGFARRRADAPRNFRKVVRRVQVCGRRLPVAAIDEVVPVRDLVVDRAARVTIRNAAVHAARRLIAGLLLGERHDEFVPMLDASLDRLVFAVGTCELEKPGRLAHRVVSVSFWG
jgi:hypothetical protein